MCIQFVYNFTTYCLPNNNQKNTIIPNLNNKFLITSYKKKWYISNKIMYINHDRSKIIYFCCNKNNKSIYLAKLSEYRQNEFNIINKIRNNNFCIKIKDVFRNQYGSIVIMKYYPHSDLKNFLIKKNIYNLNTLIYNLISCIDSLHKLKIYHRDIKLENFIIEKIPGFKILLSDFEMATNNLNLNNKQGSLYYLPPEYFNNNISNNKKRDIWALGVVIYYIIYQEFPFKGNSCNEIKNNILYGKLIYDIKYSQYNLLLSNLLQKNPVERKIIIF